MDRNQPQTPYFGSGASRGANYTNSAMPPPSSSGYSNSNAAMPPLGAPTTNVRWSMSSNMRQSVSGANPHRSSILNSSMMMQRPSPLQHTLNDDYGALGSSVMGPPSQNNRRMSYMPRQSISGPNLVSYGSVRDTRPLRDKNFQRSVADNLRSFLVARGYPHIIQPKAFSSPNNKDFHDMFRFLYLQIEPGFEFQKKPEEEVAILLKTMRYPAADTISRQTLSAVGAMHTWPNLLGVLAWMMDVILVIEKFNELTQVLPMTSSLHRDRDIDPKMDMTLVTPERALYHYLTKTYRIWMLTGNMQDPAVEESMAKSFMRRKEFAEAEINSRKRTNDDLRKQLEEAHAGESPLVRLEKEHHILKNDMDKFKRGIQHALPLIEEVEKANVEFRKSIANMEGEITDLERAKSEVAQIVKNQTTTRSELDRKLDERIRLRRREDEERQHVAELDSELREVEKRFQGGESEADRRVREYNALALKIMIAPASAENAGGQDFELRLNGDRARSGGPGEILSLDIRGKATPKIAALRRAMNAKTSEADNALSNVREDLDSIVEQNAEVDEELQSKESVLNSLTKKYQEEKDTVRADNTNRQDYIHNRNEHIQRMQAESNQYAADAERLDLEISAMERQAAQNREATAKQIREVLQAMRDSKRMVEQQVGALEIMASKELEEALRHLEQIVAASENQSSKPLFSAE